LALSLVHLSDASRNLSKELQGGLLIGAGAVGLLFTVLTQNALNEVAEIVEFNLTLGIGLIVSYLVSIGAVVLGILCLTVPGFFRSTTP
jgi:hypothetical protein